MANINKVLLCGRLTRDPEETKFGNGGKVAKFGFCVNERKKNANTGEWEDDPVFIDCEAFNMGNRTLADTIMRFCRKGKEVFLEGRLKLDTWEDKNGGGKRQKLKVIVFDMQFVGPKDDGDQGGGQTRQQNQSGPATGSRRSQQPASAPAYDPDFDPAPPPQGNGEEDIPF